MSYKCRFFPRKNQQTQTVQRFQNLEFPNLKPLWSKALTEKPTPVSRGIWGRGDAGRLLRNYSPRKEVGILKSHCVFPSLHHYA